jgi:hypothetical protein
MVLPRVFPDLVERYATHGFGKGRIGYGGYGAFGLAWEEGQRLPIGLSIKQLGYERVTPNCALCHTTVYRTSRTDTPHFAVGGPGHTVNIQGLPQFLFAAANDRRFTAPRLMPEIALHFPLDWIDWQLYSFFIIPKMQLAFHLAEGQLAWMGSKTAWGPGRDDAFNLPKYILTQLPWDDTIGNTDFPALWGLGNRTGQLFHAAGEATSFHAVSATSALGTGSLPGPQFDTVNEWLWQFVRNLAPPKFPASIDATLARQGRLRRSMRDLSWRRWIPAREGDPNRRDRNGSGALSDFHPEGCRAHEFRNRSSRR